MIGCIKPRTLSEEEEQKYSSIMADAQPIIRAAAEKEFDTENPSIKEFRRRYHNGTLQTLTDYVKQTMDSVKEIEYPVLQGYCRLVPGIVLPFYKAHRLRHRAVDIEDFIQEGIWAISDSMFAYSGNAKFDTYSCNAIRNRMIDYIRTDHFLSSVKKRILRMLPDLRDLMSKGLSFEQAANKLEINDSDREECFSALAVAVDGPEVAWEDFVSSYSYSSFDGEVTMEIDQVRAVIEEVGLSELERDVLYTVLGGGKKSEVSKKHSVSRMASTYAYDRALKKVKDVFAKEKVA